jgi:hypothetical protein
MYFDIQILILLIILMIFHYNNIFSSTNEKFLILDKYLRYWPGDRFSFREDYFIEFEGSPNPDGNYNIFIGKQSTRTNHAYNSGIMVILLDNSLFLRKKNGEWFSFFPDPSYLEWIPVEKSRYNYLNNVSYNCYITYKS